MNKSIVIFTEENPKTKTIEAVLRRYYSVESQNPKLEPAFDDRRFLKYYILNGISIKGISKILVGFMARTTKIVDYLFFEIDGELNGFPEINYVITNGRLVSIVEETKTLPHESRNTSFFQRAGKFAILKEYFPNINPIMYYNDECERTNKPFPKTSIFGYRLHLTMGTEIAGLETYDIPYGKFQSEEEMFSLKNKISNDSRNRNNSPLTIEYNNQTIFISAPLIQRKRPVPYDPNLGYVLGLVYVIRRVFNDTREIVIRNHGYTQKMFDKARKNHKAIYLYSAKNLGNYTFEGIEFDRDSLVFPESYFNRDTTSEKHVDILLEKVLLNHSQNNLVRFANHGGTEKTYYRSSNGEVPLENVYNGLPDLDIINLPSKKGIVIESKKWLTRKAGYEEIKKYGFYQRKLSSDYPDYDNTFWVTLNGGSLESIKKEMSSHKNILMSLSDDGYVVLSNRAPSFVKEAFDSYKVIYV